MASVEMDAIEKSFGSVQVFRDISISVADGEFIALVGPSGCGKSTMLRCIAGLEDLTGGDIRFNGKSVRDVPPSQRQAAMVFQSYALYPHKTVHENLAFALKIAGEPRALIDRKVAEAAEMLAITALLDKRPRQLSGGQRQRVAIGRAIVRAPEVFLFDEPLSNLDAALRAQMRVELARLHKRLGATMIYVTHDQTEAMTMADRIVLLESGRIRQLGTPQDLFDRPADTFVARFIGSPSMNILPVSALPDRGALRGIYGAALDRAAQFGIRPDDLSPQPHHGGIALPFRLELVESLGRQRLLYGQTGPHQITALATADPQGESAALTAAPQTVHLFDQAGLRIPPLAEAAA